MFEDIFGNGLIKLYLQKALDENRLPQTLLFSGPDGVGKSLFAKELAVKLLGSKSSVDFHLLKPESKNGLHTIEDLRGMIAKDQKPPFESEGKVFILEDIEKMMPTGANAILKTIEEPALDSTFILITSKINEVLPTILSRCTILTFQPLKETEVEIFLKNKNLSIRFAKWAHGSIGRALELVQNPLLEELFKILFQKLSYPERMAALVKFDEESHSFADHFFTSILMWYRDQELKSVGGKNELLFFPDAPIQGGSLLQKAQQGVEKARLAFSRNMKLSHCLEFLLCDLSTL